MYGGGGLHIVGAIGSEGYKLPKTTIHSRLDGKMLEVGSQQAPSRPELLFSHQGIHIARAAQALVFN